MQILDTLRAWYNGLWAAFDDENEVEIMATTKLAVGKEISDQSVPDMSETFLTKNNALTLAAGVIGGGMALLGTIEALPIIAIGGVAVATSGVVIKGVDLWQRRSNTATHNFTVGSPKSSVTGAPLRPRSRPKTRPRRGR